jgi:hypothetical protein
MKERGLECCQAAGITVFLEMGKGGMGLSELTVPHTPQSGLESSKGTHRAPGWGVGGHLRLGLAPLGLSGHFLSSLSFFFS